MPDSKTPLKSNVAQLASSPWQVTMRPDHFGGRGHQLGVLFLMTLPVLLFVRRLRGLTGLLWLAAVYWVLWFLLRQNTRFLFPIVPLLAVAATWACIELRRLPRVPRTLAAGLCAAVVLFQAALPAYRARGELAVACGWESREAFLRRRAPTYQAAEFANRRLPAGAKILSQDYATFYFDRPVTRESVFRRQTSYHNQADASKRLPELLSAAGFTHLLLAESESGGIRYNSVLRRLVENLPRQAANRIDNLLEYRFRDTDGTERFYRLMALPTAAIR